MPVQVKNGDRVKSAEGGMFIDPITKEVYDGRETEVVKESGWLNAQVEAGKLVVTNRDMTEEAASARAEREKREDAEIERQKQAQKKADDEAAKAEAQKAEDAKKTATQKPQ